MTSFWPIRYKQMSIYCQEKNYFPGTNNQTAGISLLLLAFPTFFLLSKIMVLCPKVQQLPNEPEYQGHTQ